MYHKLNGREPPGIPAQAHSEGKKGKAEKARTNIPVSNIIEQPPLLPEESNSPCSCSFRDRPKEGWLFPVQVKHDDGFNSKKNNNKNAANFNEYNFMVKKASAKKQPGK